MRKVLFKLFIIYLGLGISGCGIHEESRSTSKQKTSISVSILPQKYFVEQIAGMEFTINVMIPPGYNPAYYEPAPKQIKLLNDSVLYFRIGHIPFEKSWIAKFKSINPSMKIIDISRGINLIENKGEEGEHENTHAEEHSHSHQGVDPHFWLSPGAVKILAVNICSALTKKFPERKEIYKEKLSLFISRIEKIDISIKEALKELKSRSFMTFHPAWSYFARDYGLIQLTIETQGKNPNPFEMVKVIKEAKEKKITTIFIQKQFRRDTAEIIAKEIKGKIIQIDPLAYDWEANMQKIADEFKKALSENGKK